MRQINVDVCEKMDSGFTRFKKQNRRIEIEGEDCNVFLYNTLVATLNRRTKHLVIHRIPQEYQTATTKELINTILVKFTRGLFQIKSIQKQWYIIHNKNRIIWASDCDLTFENEQMVII
jgi:hypothetical protein